MSSVKFKAETKRNEPPAVCDLKNHIRSLAIPERNILWRWFDSNPDAIHELIDAAAEDTPDLSDPEVSKRLNLPHLP